MTTKRMIAVRLDDRERKRLEKAAELTGQSPERFMEKASDGVARQLLLDWAVARYREGDTTYGLLAEETGLWIEEIMEEMGRTDRGEALDRFLEMCRSVAHGNEEFVRLAEAAVEKVRAEQPDHS